jgi:long-subunit fatty acid transport protein
MLMFVWLTLADADASAYYFADVGVRAFGRGGAFIAGADDINAQYYNPAALSRIKGGRFTLTSPPSISTSTLTAPTR